MNSADVLKDASWGHTAPAGAFVHHESNNQPSCEHPRPEPAARALQ